MEGYDDFGIKRKVLKDEEGRRKNGKQWADACNVGGRGSERSPRLLHLHQHPCLAESFENKERLVILRTARYGYVTLDVL